MSGFEIAGVVLGSIPLLISGLEHYQHGISTIRKWRRYKRELATMISNLKTEKTRLQDICEKLLDGLVPASQIEIMIENPFGSDWHSDAIRKKIEGRLWRSPDNFEEIMRNMEAAIKEMIQRLGPEPDGKMKWETDSFLRREIKGLVFTFKRSDHEDQMKTIISGITSLESLIKRSIDMEPARKLRSKGRLTRLIREASGSLYRALRYGFRCGCQHEVHLHLESCSAEITPMDDDEEIIRELEFQLALTYSAKTGTNNGQKSREGVNREEVSIRALPSRALNSSTLATKQSKTKKRVSFADSPSSTATMKFVEQTSMTAVQTPPLTPTADSFNSKMVDCINLCQSIRRCQKKKALECYGMISDLAMPLCRDFGVYPTPASESQSSWSTVTLREVLENPGLFTRMSFTSKLQLAATISSSFLQLHQTPWLPQVLTSREIMFLKRGEQIQYEHAFVMRSLPERWEGATDISAPDGRSPALLHLGVLLLELHIGATIESQSAEFESSFRGISRPMRLSMEAGRLLQERRIWSLNYAGAVQICVCGDFANPRLDLSDEDFRQEVYEKVVAPLETDLRNATWSYSHSN